MSVQQSDLGTPSQAYLDMAAELARRLAADAKERDRRGGAPLEQIGWLRESGLLTLSIPRIYGGEEQAWSVLLKIVRVLARADASIAHLYGFHCINLAAPRWKGTEEQAKTLLTESVRERWFWGNSVNYGDRRLTGRRDGKCWILNGLKGFSSGSPGSNRLVITWRDEETEELLFGVIPTDKPGVTVHDDWDGIGQRQTGSGTVQFEHVVLKEDELLQSTEHSQSAFATLTSVLSKSVLTNVYVGIAEGAIAEACEYTQTKSRPWIASGVEKATDDPWIRRQYGELWTQTVAAASLADRAMEKLDVVWSRGHSLTFEERGETAVLVGAANVFAGNSALEVTSRIFEVMGARSATVTQGFDRFWRNVRTHTLHDPVEYKLRSVGHWLLNGEYPSPVYG
ncbi:acyl-CoA dehydrogenase family protein [Cohnella massiliensis]|uniref:acyl-CoA dehydrogenase family protein n=1 Tax=Cohnella massiliensis TaxID=1816691 RepID=UPI0009BB5864|nr:acyl-CoA dehydrogenase family protein [Cohnella massiliensis]